MTYEHAHPLLTDVFHKNYSPRIDVIQAAVSGYAFSSSAISEAACKAMEREVASLTLKEDSKVAKPINAGTSHQVKQMHERAYLPVGHISVPIATLVTKALVKQVKRLSNIYPELDDWLPTEAGYQRYRSTSDWISPHRDRRTDQLLAATITINGSALVRTYEPIGDPDDYNNLRQIDEFRTSPGSIMFLRAPGFASGERVIHEAMPPDVGSRLILNLRMRPDILPSPTEQDS